MADIYDSAFRTVLNDCSKLIIPIINVSFGEHYTGNEQITFSPNEHFIDQQNAPDSKMLIRLFEYDAQIALDQGDMSKEVLTVEFPNTAVLYLRYAKITTPDTYKYVIKTPGGSIEYDVPIFKTQQYTLDEIFDKDLLLLIPFYIFSKEAAFSEYENNPSKLETLKSEYLEIIARLDQLVEDGRLSDFDRTTLLETANDVINEIAKKYQNVVKGVGKVMGGALLETNARRIKNEGFTEGIAKGKVEVFLNLIADGIPKNKAQRLTEIDDDLVEKALKSRKK